MARFVSLLAFHFISALGWTACSREGGAADLRWDINFKCAADAVLTDHVHVRVLRDGCGGTDPAYDTMLTSGEEGPAELIRPGEYTLEVTAKTADGVPLAFACKAQTLPAKRLEILLSSQSCDRQTEELDGGKLPVTRDASQDEDDNTDQIPIADAAACPEGGCQGGCKIDPGPCACSEFEGKTYLTCSEAKSWSEARKACKGLGTDLAVIESHAENAHIAAQISGKTAWIGASDRGDDGVGSLAGLTGCDPSCRRPIKGAEGIWKWVDTASGKEDGPMFCTHSLSTNQCPSGGGTYVNWAAGEPNNTVPKEACGIGYYPSQSCDEGEDCGAMGSGGSWQDLECKAQHAYVCESR